MKLIIKKIATSLILIVLAFSYSLTTSANGINSAFSNADTVAQDAGYENSKSITVLAGEIVQLALSILGVLCVVFMIYAGFLWLTAAGNEQRVDKAKKVIFESIIGLIIILAAYAITYFIVIAFKNQVNIQ